MTAPTPNTGAPLLLSAHSVTTVDTVHCCDALSLLRALGDASIDMILTSPPYDNLRTYKGYSWSFEPIAHEMYRVLKPGGVAVWVVGDSVVDGSETLIGFEQALHFKNVTGFRVHDTMIYEKDSSHLPDPTRYLQTFEYMFVLSKGRPRTINQQKQSNRWAGHNSAGAIRRMRESDGRMTERVRLATPPMGLMGNVWRIPSGFMKTTTDVIAFEHPAMFPESLAERHIATWSNPGDVVLDFFMGSGTTAKMARNLGRHYIGCDISSEYVALARRRLADTDPYQPTTLSTGDKQLSLFSELSA